MNTHNVHPLQRDDVRLQTVGVEVGEAVGGGLETIPQCPDLDMSE